MSDKDREAFEKWFPAGRELLEYPNSGDAPTGFKAGWQACAAHYAPKLTEQVLDKAAQAIYDQKVHRQEFGNYSYTWPESEQDEGYRGDGGWVNLVPSHIQTICREEAKAALRAAGVRFKGGA
jgi:hypothetical protein